MVFPPVKLQRSRHADAPSGAATTCHATSPDGELPAWLMASISASTANGFGKYATAPEAASWARAVALSYAVMKMTGRDLLCTCRQRYRSKPDIPGNWT